MFGKKSGINDIIGGALADQITKKDKYRKDCESCVSVTNSPIEVCFCSFNMKPRQVSVILMCPKDCPNYKAVWHEEV